MNIFINLYNKIKCHFGKHRNEVVLDDGKSPIVHRCKNCNDRFVEFRTLTQKLNWGFMHCPDISDYSKNEFKEILGKLKTT